MRGFGERRVAGGRIAVLHPGGDVVGGVRPDQRRAFGNGVGQRGDDRKFVVFDNDGFKRIPGLVRRFGDQRDNLLADETDDIDRQRRSQGRGGRRAVGALEHGRQRQRFDPGGHEVLASVNGENARHAGGRGGVDGNDPGMCHGRAQETDPGLVRQGKVIRVPAGADEQTRVLDPPDVAPAAKPRGRGSRWRGSRWCRSGLSSFRPACLILWRRVVEVHADMRTRHRNCRFRSTGMASGLGPRASGPGRRPNHSESGGPSRLSLHCWAWPGSLERCLTPNVRGSSRARPSAREPRPGPERQAPAHKRPEAKRRRQAERCRRRYVAPSSSRASRNASRRTNPDANPSPDETPMPQRASASTGSLRKRRSWPRKSRFARGKKCFAWSLLLMDHGTRRLSGRSDTGGRSTILGPGRPGRRHSRSASRPKRPATLF